LSLAPAGLVLERLESALGVVLVFARSPSQASNCPSCGTASRAVHSRYHRTLSDLPSHGHVVRIWLQVRRFRCGQPSCRQKIFAERLDESIARPFGRRTTRLERIVHHVGLALGGRPGQSLARRLLLPVSKDTLLRVVRHHAMSRTAPPRIVGIDDWAWKRGHRYGTIVCDLEQRRIIDLLPDREAATVQSWLAARPSIAVIARDRGGGYGQAAARGRPEALQVADRWHLMENASAAFLAAVRQSMRPIREALRAGVVDPDRLTSSELRQYNGWQRREEANAMIRALAKGAVPIKEIVRRTGHARGVVRQVVRGGRTDVFRPRASSLEPFLGRLEAEWAAGCRNGAELWRRLRAAGFSGALRVVTEWTTRRRADDATTGPRRAPSARAIARMMTAGADRLSRSEAAFVVAIEAAVPALVAARDLMDQFHRLIRRRDGAALDPWLENAASGLLASFAAGIARDRNAVRAAIVEPWSNGQTEGQITKLKLVKRQMYGRAKLDLLRARLLGAA
jgi:transposase